MLDKIKKIFDYRDMISSLVKRDLKGRYLGSVLGFFWSFVNPLGQIIIYTVVFSTIFRTGLPNYHIYIVSGFIPWMFFAQALSDSAMCIRNQADMVKKIYFPREVLPISNVTSQFVNMLFCFVVVFAILILTAYGMNFKALLFLPLVMIIEYMFTLGMCFIFSAVTVYLRDMQQIIGLVLMAWIYASPIMYGINLIPESIRNYYINLNPMAPILLSYQNIIYYKTLPPVSLLISLVLSIVLLVVGFIVFGKLEKNFIEEL